MLHVQEYLKANSLNALKVDHGINYRVDEKSYKFSLNYDQIEAQDSDPIAKECRGLILRKEDGSELSEWDRGYPLGNTIVLARPFDRFFNYGQEAADDINLEHPATAFYEKIDGTLCIVYYDDIKQEWCVATRGVPEANLPIDGFHEHTFRSLFEKACQETTGKDFQTWTLQNLKRHMTYMFELTSPVNRIVVAYENYRITLLGARETDTGKEIDPTFINVRTPIVQRYRFGNLNEMIDFVNNCDPTQFEGIVVCDNKFRRIKVKNASYLALNKVRDSALKSPRALMELILLGKLDDALPLLPEHIQDRADQMRVSFNEWLKRQSVVYKEAKHRADEEAPLTNPDSPAFQKEHRKAYALAVKELQGWLPALMAMYEGKAQSAFEFLETKKSKDGSFPNSLLDKLMADMQVS